MIDDNLKILLDSLILPELRERKFRGSFPNFYRDRNGHFDLLKLSLHSTGSFVCELSYVDLNRENLVDLCKDLNPRQFRTYQTINKSLKNTGFMINFTHTPELDSSPMQSAADRLLSYIILDAESWWQEQYPHSH